MAEVKEAKRRLTSDIRWRIVPPAGAEGVKSFNKPARRDDRGCVVNFRVLVGYPQGIKN